MANKAYSLTFKQHAVALGRQMGAEAASKQLGITGRETLRRWMEAAGAPPELQGTQAQWQAQFDLAHAQTMSKLASGKLSAVETATIKGIADRNLREVKATDPAAVAEAAFDRAYRRYGFCAIIAKRMANRMGESLDDLITAFEEMIGDPGDPTQSTQGWEELALIALQDYHKDHGCIPDNDATYRTPCPAPLDNIWTYLLSLGDLEDWLDARRAWDHAAMERQLERNRQVQEEARLRALDAETAKLVEAAEAYLRDHAA